MAVASVNCPLNIALVIVLFTNPYACLCRCPDHESEALLSFNITFTNPGFPPPWSNRTDCCEWAGIECDQDKNHVVGFSSVNPYPHDYGIRGGVLSDSLCNLRFLTSIDIENTGFKGTLPSCLGKLTHLNSLSIINNENFYYLHFPNKGKNGLSGIIPASICMLSNLTSLQLDGNQLSGTLPSCLGNLFSLSRLSLSKNKISGKIPFHLGNLSLLEYLDVSFNRLSGTIPASFAGLSSLTGLRANGNAFNESIPYSALPSSIDTLYLSLNNQLTISETIFHNLTGLQYLYLSNCILNISASWIPRFQLHRLELVSCQTDGQFPSWISTQFFLVSLTLANNNLAGEIPSWLWDNGGSLSELNLSRNHLHGRLFPNGPIDHMSVLDVSGNELSGYMPSMWPSDLYVVMLNDNLLIGNIPLSLCNITSLLKLNLENNKLDGTIPHCLTGGSLGVLNLGNNNLEGSMPLELIESSAMLSLVVRNNKLSGTFPPSVINNTQLQVLDIGHNRFTGPIPKSIGNLSALQVLVITDNHFRGSIPSEIGQLKQLQILDLSFNNISGPIPHEILSLQAMSAATEDGYMLVNFLVYGRGWFEDSSHDEFDMIFKGIDQHYSYILSTLKGIDLSNNQLNGALPSDFGMLKGLRFLNVSMNKLSGVIPNSLGELSQLESLDLSTNKFSGNIPLDLQSLSYLASLNLSNNNLSGSIPQGGQMITFENTSYSGNPFLQGCPLPKNCNWPKFAPPPPVATIDDAEDEEETPWYEIGLGLSHGVGFTGVVILLVAKTKWREKYFKGVDMILKFLFPPLHNRKL